MARVIQGGDATFNALVYGGQKHPGTMQFLENQMQRMGDFFSQTGSAISAGAQQFLQASQSIFDKFNSADAIRAAQAAIHKVQSFFQPEIVRSLWDLPDFQNASLTMQRWVMANPMVRQMYHAQRLDGYSDTYTDLQPGVFGPEHYDYRRVMQGMVMDDPADPDNWKATIFMDDLIDGDRELLHTEKTDILTTWDIVERILDQGEDDPTSAYGGKL